MNGHWERIETLAEFLREPARCLLRDCETKLHRTLLVVQAWRSLDAQMQIYQHGRTYSRETGEWFVTDPILVKTNAKPGQSAHNVVTLDNRPAALGWDVVPLYENGNPEWDAPDAFWEDLYDLAWKYGFDPLGDPTGAYLKWDRSHLEEPAWKYKMHGLGLRFPEPPREDL